jgi:hypothetical protein
MSLINRGAKRTQVPRPAVAPGQAISARAKPGAVSRPPGQAKVIGTQVPQAISDLVDAKVAAGEFRSRSDFTLSAIRYYMEHLERKKKR